MGTETSKLSDSETDTMDSYIDRDGGYVVNKHRRAATVTEIDLGIGRERLLYNVRNCCVYKYLAQVIRFREGGKDGSRAMSLAENYSIIFDYVGTLKQVS